MKTVKMLSLDTASRDSGWAYWENAVLKDHGVIHVPEKIKEPTAKLDCMVEGLIKLLKDKNPDIVVIEMTVVPNNTGTQRILSEIVGVVRGWCYSQKKNVDFIRLRPTEWRKLVREKTEKVPKSKKDGLKQWDIKKAKELYHFKPIDDNEADGVLLGHAYKRLFGLK
ncbi:MAG: hypothetical protein K6E47_14810 [Lachnospiraceae bacterium]|nr:hypothetical protein [Lachnospiraceae bacterium]